MNAPFPYFGGKRDIAAQVWARFGAVKQYIEPFCGSAAMLLAAPAPASLEVIGDANGFVANFWRATVLQPAEVARWADYPVSHLDLGARHGWLMEQRERVAAQLQDPNDPGDAQVAGWWLWGQCCWIGSGWCEWDRAGKIPHVSDAGRGVQAAGKIPHVSDAGRGVQAAGQIPHVSNAGMGVQAAGQIPHVSNAGMGGTSRRADTARGPGKVPHLSNAGMGVQAAGQVQEHLSSAPVLWTSCGRTAWRWLHELSQRMERVRVVHGAWNRCLNHHYGATSTAVFLDPPYDGYEDLYHAAPIAQQVAEWCRANSEIRIALCGHRGDYDLPGWDVLEWSRGKLTYSGGKTTAEECIWFSQACLPVSTQRSLFA